LSNFGDPFREIFKEVITIEKDIARKKAEEIARKKEEERQKLLDARCAEVCVMNNAEVEVCVLHSRIGNVCKE
jgi:hypothetical protein